MKGRPNCTCDATTKMQCNDIMLPEDRCLGSEQQHVVVGLGVRTGTKAKRPQTVLAHDAVTITLLRWLRSLGSGSDSLLGYSYEQYRRILAKSCIASGLGDMGISPHSPRAGFASDAISNGWGFARTMETGRWISESSLRTYIDIVSVAGILSNLRTRHLSAPMAYCVQHVFLFFPGSESCVPLSRTHGAQGLEVLRDRRCLHAAGGAPVLGSADDLAELQDQGPREHSDTVRAGRGAGGRGRRLKASAPPAKALGVPAARGRGRA